MRAISVKRSIILIFALVSVALFAIGTSFAARALAYENTYSAGNDYSDAAALQARYSELVGEIEERETALGEYALGFSEVKELIESKFGRDKLNETGDYLAENYLYGNKGLNAIAGICELAQDIKANYAEGGVYVSSNPDGLKNYQIREIKDRAAELLDRLKLKNFRSSDYLYENAYALYSAFSVEGFKAERDEINGYIRAAEEKVGYYFAYYYGDKFGRAYIEETVYSGNADDVLSDKEASVAAISAAADGAADKADALNGINAAAEEYAKKFADRKPSLETAAERAFKELSAETDTGKVVSGCETALKNYSALTTLPHFDGEHETDLKTGSFVGADEGGGDTAVAREILKLYKKATLNGIADVKSEKTGNYGITARGVIADNAAIAAALADALTSSGELPAEAVYTVGSLTVKSGGDIIEAFSASYENDGTLKAGDATSENVSDYKNVATLSYDGEKFAVTLTCLSGEEENPVFDCGGKLGVSDTVALAVKRNVNLIANGKRQGISDENKEKVSGKTLKYSFNISVLQPNGLGGFSEKTDFSDLEGCSYRVSVTFKNDAETAESGLAAIYYNHTKITDVMDVKWEGNVMTFTVNDVNEALMVNILKPEKWTDFALLAVIGLAALVVLFLLVWLIVKLVKNKKFRVVFDAAGGKYTKVIRVKHRGQFSYPKEPKRKNYVFMGWFTDKKCTTRFASTELTKRKNVTVYAKWMKLSDYEKLNAEYRKLSAEVSSEVKEIDAQYFNSLQKDPQIEKLETEKRSYEAKRAEEERKTEEVKLQAIREIERSKNNEDARVKAERSAEETEQRLQMVLAERDEAIRRARQDERERLLDQIRPNGGFVAIGGVSEESGADAYAGKSPEEIEEIIRKVKEDTARETEERVRREMEEEAKRRAEEEERIARIVDERIRAREEEKIREKEETELRAKEEEEKRRLEEERINELVNKRVKELAEQKEREDAELARRKAAEEAKTAADLAIMAALGSRRDAAGGTIAEEGRIEAAADNAVFDELKAEINSYKKADNLEYALEEKKDVIKIAKTSGGVTLETNVPSETLNERGYSTEKTEFGSKMTVTADNKEEAKDVIQDAMNENGYIQGGEPTVTESSDEERAKGFVFTARADRVAETVAEFYNVIRKEVSSFVSEKPVEKDTPLVKMFKVKNKVIAIYLNHTGDGLVPSEEDIAAKGYLSYIVVRNADDCKKAVKAIDETMKAHGLVKVPREANFEDATDAKGFEYVLKK